MSDLSTLSPNMSDLSTLSPSSSIFNTSFETVVGNNFNVPPTPIPIHWTPEDLEYEMEDALQNEVEVANEQELEIMAARSRGMAGAGLVTDNELGLLLKKTLIKIALNLIQDKIVTTFWKECVRRFMAVIEMSAEELLF